MKTIKAFLCLLLSVSMMTLVFAGCNDVGGGHMVMTEDSTTIDDKNNTTEDIKDMFDSLSKDKEYSILFIGNSYTYYNDTVPKMFKKIAESVGYKVNVDSVTKGGYSLEQFADPSDEKGKEVDERLTSNKYDYVFLQEQSHTPVSNPEKFYSGVRKLVLKIKDSGAEPVFYCTWGRRADNKDIQKFNLIDNETMTWNLAAAYRKMGEELKAPVANVGLVFRDLYTSSGIGLYHEDGSHPSEVGTYVAALTLFSTLFGVSTADVTYDFYLHAPTWTTIKDSVEGIVFNTPEIPDKYLEAYGLK